MQPTIGIGDQAPGSWLSSQGVLESDETKISAQISNILRVQLNKQPNAWSEGILLPLVFDCYATKVFCPPWYWNRGPGWLPSQGVLQSDETIISAKISNFSRGCDSDSRDVSKRVYILGRRVHCGALLTFTSSIWNGSGGSDGQISDFALRCDQN